MHSSKKGGEVSFATLHPFQILDWVQAYSEILLIGGKGVTTEYFINWLHAHYISGQL